MLLAALVWVAPPAASQSSACTWTVVASPNPGNKESALGGIDGSGDDVWSVGSFKNRGKAARTFVAHNTTEGWKQVPSPNLNDLPNGLSDVTYLAPDDVWAVGQARKAEGRTRGLIEHWDGQRWSLVTAPSSGRPNERFVGIDAPPPSDLPTDPLGTFDVWAVGVSAREDGSRPRPLMAHYNGTDWSLVPTPPAGGPAGLFSVHALAPNNAWAVGSYREGGRSRTLAMHWDGIAWSVVETPNPSPEGNVLTGVSGDAFDDVWAVGVRMEGAPLVLHFNGREWATVSAPVGLGESAAMFGVAASGGDVWGVGFSISTIPTPEARTLIMTGDATGWAEMNSPSPGAFALLLGVAVPRDGVPWAAGASITTDGRTTRTLLMKCAP